MNIYHFWKFRFIKHNDKRYPLKFTKYKYGYYVNWGRYHIHFTSHKGEKE